MEGLTSPVKPDGPVLRAWLDQNGVTQLADDMDPSSSVRLVAHGRSLVEGLRQDQRQDGLRAEGSFEYEDVFEEEDAKAGGPNQELLPNGRHGEGAFAYEYVFEEEDAKAGGAFDAYASEEEESIGGAASITPFFPHPLDGASLSISQQQSFEIAEEGVLEEPELPLWRSSRDDGFEEEKAEAVAAQEEERRKAEEESRAVAAAAAEVAMREEERRIAQAHEEEKSRASVAAATAKVAARKEERRRVQAQEEEEEKSRAMAASIAAAEVAAREEERRAAQAEEEAIEATLISQEVGDVIGLSEKGVGGADLLQQARELQLEVVESIKKSVAEKQLNRRRSLEQELRFKSRYKTADMRMKQRSGQVEGYGFSSITAGLHRIDYHNTLEWSPINTAKDGWSHHMAGVVEHYMEDRGTPLYGSPSVSPPNASPQNASNATPKHGSRHSAPKYGSPMHASPKANFKRSSSRVPGENYMNEEDWNIAPSTPKNMIAAKSQLSQMNLEDFIDATLEKDAHNFALPSTFSAKFTLKDLQSTTLIDSRFGWQKEDGKVHRGWGKVRRAVGVSTHTTYNPHSGGIEMKRPGSPDKLEGHMAAKARKEAKAVHAKLVEIKSKALQKPMLRPKVVTPAHEFAASLLQRPSTPGSPPSRPESAGYKFVDPQRVQPANVKMDVVRVRELSDQEAIRVMEEKDHQHQQGNALTKRRHDQRLLANYSGLLYKDPSQHGTWNCLSPSQLPRPENPNPDEIGPGREDIRWAGANLNSYRPWSSFLRPSSASACSNMLSTAFPELRISTAPDAGVLADIAETRPEVRRPSTAGPRTPNSRKMPSSPSRNSSPSHAFRPSKAGAGSTRGRSAPSPSSRGRGLDVTADAQAGDTAGDGAGDRVRAVAEGRTASPKPSPKPSPAPSPKSIVQKVAEVLSVQKGRARKVRPALLFSILTPGKALRVHVER